MGPIGIPELIIVLVILLVIFGPKRLPGLGRSLGSGMREFKDSISGASKDDDEDERPRLEAAPTTAAPATAAPATPAETAPEAVPAERPDDAQAYGPRT
jgi:sec-independent protein translocase protein TatA